MQGGEAQHLRTLGADHDRDPPGPGTDGSVLEIPSRVEGTLEIGVAISEQRQDDLESLFEAADGPIFRQAKGVALAASVTGAEAEHDPATADLVERFDCLRHDPGVVVERREDPRADL